MPSRRFFAGLILMMLLGILTGSIFAQEGELPLPADDSASMATAEPDAFGTAQPSSEAVFLNDDFENGLQFWNASREMRVIQDETGNSAAELLPGLTLTPVSDARLTAFKATIWFNLRDTEQKGSSELNLQFGYGYILTVNPQGAALTRTDLTAATSAAVHPTGVWQRLDLMVSDSRIAVSINEALELEYTPAAAFSNSVLSPFTIGMGSVGSVLIDDVRIVHGLETDAPVSFSTLEVPTTLEFDATRLSGELVQLLQAANTENAEALAESYGLQRDEKSRIGVEIWGAEGVSGEALTKLVEAAGGRIETVDYKRVSARLSLEAIAQLSLSDQVSVIHLTPRLSAATIEDTAGALRLNVANTRDPQGDIASEGYDITGVQAWHNAGYIGSGLDIAVIDVGFGAPGTAFNNNMACLPTDAITLEFGTQAAGDSNRGLSMLEVVCDVAPGSEVRLYKAQNTDQLFDALQAAVADTNKVIVIGVDLGPNVSPGDGTLGYSSTKDPYAALQAARDAGIVVVAAAGNSRQSYTTFNLPAATQVTMTITARPGTPVNLGWNDWDASPNGGATREDFSAALSGAGFSTLNKPPRGSSNPGYQFVIPASCTASGGLCTTTLTISGLVGDISTVQVQAGGLDSTITAVAGVTPFERFGTLARPADSDDVIAAGAVCASNQNNFPSLEYSSRGPVYLGGGDYTEIGEGPFTGNQVKPEVVAPAQVSTSQQLVTDLNLCNQGFGGSQAGAAHVAGQVAVLLSNPEIDSFQQPSSPGELMLNILKYLRTHAFDLPFGIPAPTDANNTGYDMRRGAGVPVLGSPTFNPDTLPNPATFIPPNRIPSGECTAPTDALIFVGPYNVGASNMDGTITRPYNHLSQAIKKASEAPSRCVIALPGEYSSPLYIADPGELVNDVTVFAYASVVRIPVQPSTYYVVNSYTKAVGGFDKRGGVYVEEEGFKFSGFNIISGVIFATGTQGEPGVLVADTATGVQFTNNTIQGFTTRDLPLIQIVDGSQNVVIRRNNFLDNVNATNPDNPEVFEGSMTLIAVENSGATTGRIFIDQNTFRGNQSITGQWSLDGLPDAGEGTFKLFTWMSLIRTIDSYTDITSNTFHENEAKTLIQAVTRLTDAPFETRILGNAIVDNRITSADSTLSPGPLIHLFNMRRIYVVNNTMARNNLTESGSNGVLVGRGDDVAFNFNEGEANNNNSGSLGSTLTNWEFHGNFVMDNVVDNDFNSDGTIDSTDPAASQVIGDLEAPGVGCRNIAGEEDQGAKHNWLFRAAASPGICGPAFSDPANSNLALDPFPRDSQYEPTGGVVYILGGDPEDRFSPAYYSLAGSSDDSEPDGIDEGFDSFVDTTLTEFAAGKDPRGVLRQNDGEADGSIQIDIGAYEFTPLELVSPIELTVPEDSGVITVELNEEYLIAGFAPFQIEIIRYPEYYGVAGVDGSTCDARFTAEARGVSVDFLTDGTPVLSYCPPADFHTQTADPDFVLSDAGFDFTLSDLSAATANSTVQFTITPTDDAVLATTLGDNVPSGDIIDVAVGIGRPIEQNTVRLRPFVDFSDNFVFSERNNTIEPTAQDEVDYPYTYGTPTLVDDPGNQNAAYLVDNLQIVNIVQGKIGFELSTAAPPSGGFAQAKFSYTVTDARGGEVTNIITVRALTPPSDFLLLSPADDTNFGKTSDVRIFTWEAGDNTQDYIFNLERISSTVPETVLNLTGLTPAADTDNLTCAGGTCTLQLTDPQQADITTGEYRWTVTANNQGVTTVATNAPFTFTVNIGINLIKNGSFEVPGATNKEAADWKGKGIDNDKRACNKVNRPGKPDKIIAFEGECVFQFKGDGAPVVTSISQKFGSFGKAGDPIEFSYHAEAKNLAGDISGSVKLKYNNGQKDKIVLDPDTNTYDYTRFSIEDTLTDGVAKGKVKFQMKNIAGRLRLDAVKLVYETDENFTLLTPLNNDVYTSAADIMRLSWATSAGAATYDLEVKLGTTTVFTAVGLTPDSDSDALSCPENVCQYDLSGAQQGALTGGTYTWQVTSKGGFTTPAMNGPFTFTVDTALTNLAANGGFEDTNNNDLPEGWKDKNIGASKATCNKPADGKYPAYQGACSFEFSGSPDYNGKLSQNASITSVNVGDTLTLAAVISGNGAEDSAGKVDVKVIYTTGEKDKRTITVPVGSTPFTRYTQELIVGQSVDKIKLSVAYKGKGGFTIDNVQLLDSTP
jgi:hypothetical protein